MRVESYVHRQQSALGPTGGIGLLISTRMVLASRISNFAYAPQSGMRIEAQQ